MFKITDQILCRILTQFCIWHASAAATLINQDNAIIGPKPLKKLDFNTYGGLYRSVNLLVKNPLYITDEMHANKVASGGIFVSYPKVSKTNSTIEVKTHIANEYTEDKDFSIKQSLYLGENLVTEIVNDKANLTSGNDKQFIQQLDVQQAKLWSPAQPNLYQLVTEIYLNKELVEQKSTRIGIRKFEFNDGRAEKNVEQNILLDVLSQGEKRALYILNLLFEIEVRIQDHQRKLRCSVPQFRSRSRKTEVGCRRLSSGL